MKNKQILLQEISQSKYSLSIAVSWLTDIDLIKVLKAKVKEGIILKIVLSKSEWNHLRYYDFLELIESGAIVNKRGSLKPGDGSFMHCKFCIIDDAIVLHGSYNWTKNASINDENLAIDKDYEVVRKFNKDFHFLLKDSDNYGKDLNEDSIKALIPILTEKEEKGFDPETEHNDLNIETSLIKPEQSIVKSNLECTSVEQLKEWDFKDQNAEIKEINCNLYRINKLQISNYFSVTIGDMYAKVNCRIYSSLLLNSLITNNNFRVLYSTLGGIPEILLSMLLSTPSGLSIYGPMKFKLYDDSNYFEITNNGRNKAFYLSAYEPSAYKEYQEEVYKQGYNIMFKIIKGEMNLDDFNSRFKKIDWWLK